MQIHDKIANDLNNILGKKFDKLTIANEQAQSTIDPSKGRIFTLDYTASGKSYGSVTVNIVDPNSVVVYYNNNIAEDMRYDDKKDWYNFLKELRFFAKRNLMNFDVRNIGKQQLDKTDYAYIKTNDTAYSSDEITMESKLHGGIKTSYQDFGESRLIIKHRKAVEEDKRGARTRQIHSMYIEDSSKQRTRIPFNYLTGARALAQHVNQGGSISDEFGQHIVEMIQEVVDLKKFVKAFKTATNFANDDAYKIIEQAQQRAQGINATLKTLAGPKGYVTYTEQYEPTDESIEQADLDDIRSKLVRIEQDNIVDTVLPSLARGIKAMEIKENSLSALANDESAKIELLPNAEEDQDIKDYIEYIKALKKSGRKTSEDPMDGLVNRIILTLTKRGNDDLHQALASLDTSRAEDKATAYKLASKYLKGMIDYISPKAKKAKKTEAEQLDDWANNLVEGTWAIPNTEEAVEKLEELMKDELPVGVDAENATNAMYGIIGDDQLFDELEELAEKDAEADARPVISLWIEKHMGRYNMPEDLLNRVIAIASGESVEEGYTVLPNIDTDRYQERAGLEGPIRAKNGKVVYYDKAEGSYYDPDTDMYISDDEWAEMNEGLVNDVMKQGIDQLMKKQIRAMFNKSAGDEGAIEMIAKKLEIPVADVKRMLDEEQAMEDLRRLSGLKLEEDELSVMANSMDKVERAYAEIVKGDAEETEVGDYISRGMTKDQILKLIDMLEPQGYDKDFLLKDLAPMMEQELDEAEVEESIQYMYSLKDKGMSIEEIAKELNMTADEVRDAMSKTEEPVTEGEEKPYICVHAKKGKHECHASSSYEAAKKAAEHWKMKSTAGIDAHLAVEESHDEYADSRKIYDEDGVEIFIYDTDNEGSAVEVYKDGEEVATGFYDSMAGDFVVNGKSFDDLEALGAHYGIPDLVPEETTELEEMKQRLLKLAGLA
jgi:predicted DNA-binding protein YlxM (UPF0122 family)